jgi:hypothetical protein
MRVKLGLEFGAAVVGGLGRAPDGPATVRGQARDVVEPNTGRVAVVIAGGGGGGIPTAYLSTSLLRRPHASDDDNSK